MNGEQAVSTVVLVRHAQSEWNRQGRFTGWADPALTGQGRAEAERAAEILAASGIRFRAAFTSRLQRARDTARIILRGMGAAGLPLEADWRLNERHYGALQGQDKAAMTARVGGAQVWRWRRGYADLPPPVAVADPAHPRHDPRWADIDRVQLPGSESLADTRARVMAFWEQRIVPRMGGTDSLLVASHGNTLRALLMALDDMSVEQVESFEIPTGQPIICRFDRGGRLLGRHYLDGERPLAA